MSLQREKYIDGMKGLACFFIVFGHFTGIYKYAENLGQIDTWLIRESTKEPFAFLSAESYWLCLFLVISGYLLIGSTPPEIAESFC